MVHIRRVIVFDYIYDYGFVMRVTKRNINYEIRL